MKFKTNDIIITNFGFIYMVDSIDSYVNMYKLTLLGFSQSKKIDDFSLSSNIDKGYWYYSTDIEYDAHVIDNNFQKQIYKCMVFI